MYDIARNYSGDRIRLQRHEARSTHMSIGTILLIVLILILIGAIPAWPHSKSWGYAPSGGLGLVVVILVVLLLLGKL